MKTFRRVLGLLVAVLCSAPAPQAHASSAELEALVQAVRQEAMQEASFDQARVQKFLADKDAQKKLLQEAKDQLARANKRADELRANYEANEKTLTSYEEDLRERSGDLNDLFAIVRQTSLDANSVLETSLVSAEQSGRSTFLLEIGKGERPPSIDDIKRLWTVVLTEIAESGKVVRFPATVIKPHGEEAQQLVTRAGVFNSVSDGAFLRYLPGSQKLVEFSRQPPSRFQRMAQALETSSDGLHPMALDPSKGAILSLMVQSPDLTERVDQGGWIGYLILALGGVGFLIVLQRAVRLALETRAIETQASAKEIDSKNPLGRMKQIASAITDQNVESIALRLDEQLAQESSRLNRGLATVAVLAAVSPLLGLLGTVTGMIETFQSITLFGTGDPKLMSGGISQALVTTQLGLTVAIPLVLFHSLLVGRANRLVETLGKYSSDILSGQ